MSNPSWKVDASEPGALAPSALASGTVTRRGFALGAAMAATATLIQPCDALTQIPPEAGTPQEPSSTAQLSPEAQAEVEMKVREVFRKYGSRLSEEQKTDIRRTMAETQSGLEKMRAFALQNGDQPATVFQIYRGGRR